MSRPSLVFFDAMIMPPSITQVPLNRSGSFFNSWKDTFLFTLSSVSLENGGAQPAVMKKTNRHETTMVREQHDRITTPSGDNRLVLFFLRARAGRIP